MKKVLRKIHLWLSLPFGILIAIICFTGALLIIEKDIYRPLAYKEMLKVTPIDAPLPLDILLPKVLENAPKDAEISGVTIYSNPESSYIVDIAKPHRSTFYVDQYSGEVLGQYERPTFFKSASLLHRHLLDSSKDAVIGKNIVGITLIVFLVLLLTGIWLWWPVGKQQWRNKCRIHIRQGQYRLWYDMHTIVAVYAVVVLLGCLLTGLIWTYPSVRSATYKLLNASRNETSEPHAKLQSIGSDFALWDRVFKEIPTQPYVSVTIRHNRATALLKRNANNRATDDYIFDAQNGTILKKISYSEKPKAEKVQGWISTLHRGTWGGWFSRILTFVAVLIGASLPVTGYYLWLKRLQKKRGSR